MSLRRPSKTTTAAALALAGALLSAGCGGSSQAASTAPLLTVVTGVFPFAQAVNGIGQGRVAVVDLSPAGSDPAQLTLTSTDVEQVHEAGLVVEVGGGYQTALAQAAAGQPNVVSVQGAVGSSSPDVWLDPALMLKATSVIGQAMIKADPADKKLFSDGIQDFGSEMASVGIDYQNTLSDCPDHTIVTPDTAFSQTAQRYGFTDVVVGASNSPSSAHVATEADAVRATDATTVFSEPWAADGTATAVASATHIKLRSIDTLAGPPPNGWPAHVTYFALIEQDLSSIKNALQCADMGQN